MSIKLKAWDRGLKRWIVPKQPWTPIMVDYPPVLHIGNQGLYNWVQYTELKDKSGREIYEGDIVELVWGKESRMIDGGIENQVVIPCAFEYGIMGLHNWYPCWGELLMRPLMEKEEFKKLTRYLDCQFDPYGNRWERKIIGNIYENSELINRKE